MVTRCSRCDNEMNHVVVAQGADGNVARVKCMSCSSEHKYKLESMAAKKVASFGSSIIKKTASATASSGGSKADYRLWEEAKTGCKNKVPVSYNIAQKFDKETLIHHASLGEGAVIKSFDNKIEAIFSAGIKTLVHNKK